VRSGSGSAAGAAAAAINVRAAAISGTSTGSGVSTWPSSVADIIVTLAAGQGVEFVGLVGVGMRCRVTGFLRHPGASSATRVSSMSSSTSSSVFSRYER
jgi:hypothetical protein